MNNAINGAIPQQTLTATLTEEAKIAASLADEAKAAGTLTPGGIIVNDYRITAESIEDGNRITVKRGSEVQTIDILNGANVKNITISEVE